MRSRGQVELHPFGPELERTLHRLRREQKEAQHRNLAIMQNNVEQDHGQEQNEDLGAHCDPLINNSSYIIMLIRFPNP